MHCPSIDFTVHLILGLSVVAGTSVKIQYTLLYIQKKKMTGYFATFNIIASHTLFVFTINVVMDFITTQCSFHLCGVVG